MERMERGEARRAAVMRHRAKGRKQQKPLAPVEESGEKVYGLRDRDWETYR